MKRPTREEQRGLVRQWEATGRELERIRRDALRNRPYNWELVDALLQTVDHYEGPPRASGLVEMQRWFMLADPRPGADKSDRSDGSDGSDEVDANGIHPSG